MVLCVLGGGGVCKSILMAVGREPLRCIVCGDRSSGRQVKGDGIVRDPSGLDMLFKKVLGVAPTSKSLATISQGECPLAPSGQPLPVYPVRVCWRARVRLALVAPYRHRPAVYEQTRTVAPLWGFFFLTEVKDRCHKGPVTGIAVDGMNAIMVTSSTDGNLCFWNFETHTLDNTVDVGSPVYLLELCKDSGV